MKNVYPHFMRWLAGLCAVLLYGCGQNDRSPTVPENSASRKIADQWNVQQIDSSVRLLRNGDLVLRTGADATSYMLRQMNLTNKTYSHCGIVMIEHGYPFVYHSIGGEDNPDEKLRRDSAMLFFSPIYNERLGIARLDISAAQIDQLHHIVQRYYQLAIPFDLDFDLATNDKFYCAEFVYKSVCEATADTGYFVRTQLLARNYVGVDNLYDQRHAKIICDIRFK
jgi:hypothetical protein